MRSEGLRMDVMADRSSSYPGEWLRGVAPGPSGRVGIHVSLDWGVEFPVEVVEAGNPGYVDAEMLGISDRLAGDLVALQAWWSEHTSMGEPDGADDPGWARWHREGAELVKRLQAELGPRYEVVWT